MKTESPYSLFSNRRYRALYLLLPFANGVLLVAGYAFARGYLGVPEASMLAESSDAVPYFTRMLWHALEFLAASVVIYCVDLLVLGVAYRRSFFRSRRRILGPPEGRPRTQNAAVASAALTFAGYYAALIALDALSLWPDTQEHVTLFIALALGITFPGAVLPLLIHGERSRTGGKASSPAV